MLFNSIEFAIFLPLTFLLYWFVFKRNIKVQNIFILLVSYIFYGWWDWRFLFLIFFSSIVDFTIGLQIFKAENKTKKKLLLLLSLIINIGFLGIFKYYNFFIDNFVAAFTFFGQEIDADRINIILPVGISFYTFQTLSYSLDIYAGKFKPTKNIVAFLAFVSFFPQLVAGPIERASNLLPQFYKARKFEYSEAIDGLKQILWGGFKKVVIADNCAKYVSLAFDGYDTASSSTLILGAIFFSFQIYGDFSGYSDIAIGISRLLGFKLKQNFATPYFSRDIAEFWRKWHISLTSWFKDYIYIPLGGSRVSKGRAIINTFIIFIISGFWHGANWTFIVWGLINALLFLPLLLSNRNRKHTSTLRVNSFALSLKELFKITTTFLIVTLSWIFFRADNISVAVIYIKRLFTKTIFSIPHFKNVSIADDIILVLLITFFLLIEWFGRDDQYGLQHIFNARSKRPLKLVLWGVIGLTTLLFLGDNQEFIYFQF